MSVCVLCGFLRVVCANQWKKIDVVVKSLPVLFLLVRKCSIFFSHFISIKLVLSSFRDALDTEVDVNIQYAQLFACLMIMVIEIKNEMK